MVKSGKETVLLKSETFLACRTNQTSLLAHHIVMNVYRVLEGQGKCFTAIIVFGF